MKTVLQLASKSLQRITSTTSQKHCQRHNGPKGWVLLTKVTYFSHITRSNTKFDQISSSEYWPSTNFKISTSANISISTKLKIQDIDQTWLQNLDQDSTSLPLQNISSKILNKLLLQILPELQLQNNDQTLCSKSEQKFFSMTKPQLPYLQQTVANTILIINISNSRWERLLPIVFWQKWNEVIKQLLNTINLGRRVISILTPWADHLSIPAH